MQNDSESRVLQREGDEGEGAQRDGDAQDVENAGRGHDPPVAEPDDLFYATSAPKVEVRSGRGRGRKRREGQTRADRTLAGSLHGEARIDGMQKDAVLQNAIKDSYTSSND
jgi:hypothetical protein